MSHKPSLSNLPVNFPRNLAHFGNNKATSDSHHQTEKPIKMYK